MTSCPRPVWRWIVATVIAVPVLYVLSFGPACWAVARTGDDESHLFSCVYWPIGWLAGRGGIALVDFGTIGLPAGEQVFLPSTPNLDTGWIFGKRTDGGHYVR